MLYLHRPQTENWMQEELVEMASAEHLGSFDDSLSELIEESVSAYDDICLSDDILDSVAGGTDIPDWKLFGSKK